jgi:hypothetical protein
MPSGERKIGEKRSSEKNEKVKTDSSVHLPRSYNVI